MRGMVIAGLAAAGGAAVVGGAVGGLAVHCNKAPKDTVATARHYGPAGMCPTYLREDGDVFSGLFKIKDGHIDANGKAKNLIGLAKGEANEDGELYTSFLVDSLDLPYPAGFVDKSGTVKNWNNFVPVGKIKTQKEGVPEKQKDALGLWLIG